MNGLCYKLFATFSFTFNKNSFIGTRDTRNPVSYGLHRFGAGNNPTCLKRLPDSFT